MPDTSAPELSIVMPCLNEADTLATCIRKARASLEEHQIQGEILVADNGSSDGSLKIAEACGARIVHVPEKGYGAALMGGIEASQGQYVLMGDADDSYDFSNIFPLVQSLRAGNDLVMGCRLPGGGGEVLPGAMPFTHRWIGNPMFTFLARRMFGMPTHDVYCGLRGFTRALYDDLELRCTGMEFATEMIIKASLFKRRISEVPIRLHPDGRVSHPPHLKTVTDGLRTLRFFLIYSPRWLFLVPGALLFLVGTLVSLLVLPGPFEITEGVRLDVHSLLVAGLCCILGYQLVTFAIFTKFFAVSEGLVPPRSRLISWCEHVTLKVGVVAGTLLTLAGGAFLAYAIHLWAGEDFGPLAYGKTMRIVVPGVTTLALGVQTVFSSLFMSILGLKRRDSAKS